MTLFAQMGLFDYQPPKVRHDHPHTSYEAAASIAPITGKLRQAVYAFFISRGNYGATDSELFTAFPDKAENTMRPRRIELVEAKRLVDSGKRRQTHSGRSAIVWCVA